MVKNDDNSLVQRIIKGDVEAYRTIVERNQARIFYLGLKFFHKPEDAEDFAQEVFLKAYEKIEKFQGKVPFAAWLYRIAFNLAVNQYHLNRRRFMEVTVGDSILDLNPSPEVKVLEKEFMQRVKAILRKLPEAYNIVLKMHFFDGLSYPEISEVIDIPVNTIKSHILRAKKIIKQKLALYTKE